MGYLKYFIPFITMAMDIEKNAVGIPIVGSDIMVDCSGTYIEIKIMKNYIDNNEQWLGAGQHISLNDPMFEDPAGCQGVHDKDGNVVIRIADDFTKCGMQIEADRVKEDGIDVVKNYKFKNNVMNHVGDFVVDRALDILEFECVYPTIQQTTGAMNPLVKSAISKNIVKEISGDMRLFKNANYTGYYTEPPVLALDDMLYVEVNLEKPLISNVAEIEFAVVMEQCWGTPKRDGQGELKYYIIKNNCPVKGDESLQVRSNGNGLSAKFDIKMFKFIGEDMNDVFLHCTVRACNATASSCVPECGDRKRRSTEKTSLPFISLSHEIVAAVPIQRLREEGEEILIKETVSNPALTPGTPMFGAMIGIIAIVLVIVFGAIPITCMVVKKRKHTLS